MVALGVVLTTIADTHAPPPESSRRTSLTENTDAFSLRIMIVEGLHSIMKNMLQVHIALFPPTQVEVVSEPERNGVFLTRSCVQLTNISCGVVYKATLASLVLLRSYCYVPATLCWSVTER